MVFDRPGVKTQSLTHYTGERAFLLKTDHDYAMELKIL
jgi:hypothetical protein